MMENLDKYTYDEELEIIYELDEHEVYNPIIFVKSVENECADNIEARSRLEYMKEHKLEMYVEICENGELKDYIDKYMKELFDSYRLVLSRMKTQTPIDEMTAMSMARDNCC
jgi:hypothetical protein